MKRITTCIALIFIVSIFTSITFSPSMVGENLTGRPGDLYTFHSPNSTDAQWTTRSTITTVFDENAPALILQADIDSFRNGLIADTDIQDLKWRGTTYTLIIMTDGDQAALCVEDPTIDTPDPDTFSYFGTVVEYEWTSFVTVFTAPERTSLHLRILEPAMDLYLAPWEEGWMEETFSQLGGEPGDYIMYDDRSVHENDHPNEPYVAPTFPPFHTPPTDLGIPHPILGVSSAWYFAGVDIIRLGVFLDEDMYETGGVHPHSIRLDMFCDAMIMAFGIIFAETGGKVQIESAKKVFEQDTVIDGVSVPGYKQSWGSEDEIFHVNPIQGVNYNWDEQRAYGANGYNWPDSVASTDYWMGWNGGKFRDVSLFGLYDSWWDWNGAIGWGERVNWTSPCASPLTDQCVSPKHARWSAIQVLDTRPNSLGPRPVNELTGTIMMEMGHNFALHHSDGICHEHGWPVTVYSHRTVMSDAVCPGLWTTNISSYSSGSRTKMTDSTNQWGVSEMPLTRTIAQPNSAGDLASGGNKLLYNLMDWISPTATTNGHQECRTQYRVEYSMVRTGPSKLVMEFFNAVRSDYSRDDPNGNPIAGQWDYWLGYDRAPQVGVGLRWFDPGDIYVFRLTGDSYHGQDMHNSRQDVDYTGGGQMVAWYGSGFIRDDENYAWPSPPNTLPPLGDWPNCDASAGPNAAHLNHHPWQGNAGHLWYIWPAVNLGNNYGSTAIYYTYSQASINVHIQS